ncbi:MAG: hypothetical protein JWN67_796 [Actinomycetia bacterium]|nr:hypothetical protein [Actinomycetes bacterium]
MAVLAVLVAVVLGSPVGALTSVLAFLAACWRWGSGWLVAVVGAQAVLGPAGAVGPPSAALSSWLAAVALVVAVPGASLVAALAVGASAALVVAGPAGLDGAGTRLAATAALGLLAFGVGRLRWRRWPALVALALAVGAAALA